MSKFDRLVKDVLPEAIAIRHDLHAHPQLGYEETYASETVQRVLNECHVPFESGIAETGVVGWIAPTNQSSPQKAIALRADMDALPISEETGLPYASQHAGLMHACGHDGHTAILLAAAKVLAQMPDELHRTVKLVFQPAEEFGAGAQRMIEAGILTSSVGGVDVGVMYGLHGSPYIPVGCVATKPGPLLAGCVDFEIDFVGKGGHAAMVYSCVDPIVAAASFVSAVQTIVSRNLDPAMEPAVVSITRIQGGQAFNVIPERVNLAGTIRTFAEATFVTTRRRLTELAQGIASAHQCRAEVTFSAGYPTVQNDPVATAVAQQVADRVAGAERSFAMPAPVLASEDFSFFSQQVPSCFSFIGVIPPGRNDYPSLHSPQFDFTDDSLELGIRLMCQYALSR